MRHFNYDEKRQILIVGDGEFGPVSPSVYTYEVSGLKVVQSWLGYRMKNRRGRKSSPLDDITPSGWTADYTSELLRLLNLLTRTLDINQQQAALLGDIERGPLFEEKDLGPVPHVARKAPRENSAQHEL